MEMTTDISTFFQGDGLPLLHIAVLCRFEDLVEAMLEDVDAGQDVNAVRDQFGRTALHYAYASVHSSNITRSLINAGCTEAVFDMVCPRSILRVENSFNQIYS